MNRDDRRPPPAGDEDVDFRSEMAGVRPRAAPSRLSPERPPPPPRPLSREADERAVLQELLQGPFELDTLECGDTLVYRSAGVQDAVMRRLRRGHYRIGAEVDLHGLNRTLAQIAVSEFLADCLDRGIRCVRIIHGKGNGSPNTGPVIKTLLDGWLRRRRDVLAFCSARPVDGGTGAVYVLLRAPSYTPG
jgi:DNA-nicking Smr family endonuclease